VTIIGRLYPSTKLIAKKSNPPAPLSMNLATDSNPIREGRKEGAEERRRGYRERGKMGV
jgi:hypothetical protein